MPETLAVRHGLQTYFQLNGEDYRWWWRSFLVGGSMGFYLFLYSVVWFFQVSGNGGLSLAWWFGSHGGRRQGTSETNSSDVARSGATCLGCSRCRSTLGITL